MSYIFDCDRLDELAAGNAETFARADPFPHLVMPDFLRPDAARELFEVFPGPDDPMSWDQFGAEGYEVKLACGDETKFPLPLRQAIYQLNSGVFIRFLERLTGIDHLLPDPHLLGGGLHLIKRGGHLGIHADFNWHPGLQAHRRLNLLIYLNPDWRPAFRGELELWDTRATERRASIPPLFNQAVLFATRSDTFHGHPEPWAAPENTHRRSIAMYYYTTDRPRDELRAAHSTLYKGYHV
jgi:hypothetical protein